MIPRVLLDVHIQQSNFELLQISYKNIENVLLSLNIELGHQNLMNQQISTQTIIFNKNVHLFSISFF